MLVSALNPNDLDDLKKEVCRIFRLNGLSIKVKTIGKNVDFLDINLNLTTSIYKPYMKAGNIPTYGHSKSNHPRGILENIPKSVNKRLSKISANEVVFKAVITLTKKP